MLSLSMIVKNEEKYLWDCLNSVNGVVDEIVLIDTGSTDNTKKIAEEFGAKIYDYKWKNDFSESRNYALEKANGDWILYLDADERLTENSKDELKKITNVEGKKAFHCRIINVDEISNHPSVMSYVRLFAKKPGIQFTGKIHEQIEDSLVNNGYKIEQSSIEIIHLGYNLSKDDLKLKAKRNLDILIKEYGNKKNGYTAFQIGQSLHILEREDDAVKYFEESVKDNSLRNEYKATAYRSLAINSAENLDLDSATKFIDLSIKYDRHQPLSLLAAAKIYLKGSKLVAAIGFVKEALKYNRDYATGRRVSSQNILIDPKVIIYNGLTISLMSNDLKSVNLFLEELKNTATHVEYSFYENLINKKNILLKDDELKSIINNDNYELLFIAGNQYPDKSMIMKITKVVVDKFLNNSSFLNKYGLVLLENSLEIEAEKILERSLELNPHELSSVFYLISVYIKQNAIDKISIIINRYRPYFEVHPTLLSKLIDLEQKLTDFSR